MAPPPAGRVTIQTPAGRGLIHSHSVRVRGISSRLATRVSLGIRQSSDFSSTETLTKQGVHGGDFHGVQGARDPGVWMARQESLLIRSRAGCMVRCKMTQGRVTEVSCLLDIAIGLDRLPLAMGEQSLNTRTGKGGGQILPSPHVFCEYLSKYSFDRRDFFQYLPKNKRRTFWCKN